MHILSTNMGFLTFYMVGVCRLDHYRLLQSNEPDQIRFCKLFEGTAEHAFFLIVNAEKTHFPLQLK